MSAAVARDPELLHIIQGRMRVRLPDWNGWGARAIEEHLRRAHGVYTVRANRLTGNVLIHYDPTRTDERTLLAAIRALKRDGAGLPADSAAPLPAPLRERHGDTIRARIVMRGLDRDPSLAARVVERLNTRPGVRAHASPLTSRVLVEFAKYAVDLEALVSDVEGMELAELPGEDRPGHPLDPGPLIQGVTRTIGVTLGLTALAVQRLAGVEASPRTRTVAAEIGGVISILRSFPAIRNGLRQLLGRNVTDVALTLPGIAMLALSNNPLGLVLTASESLRLLTEVQARQKGWRQYEARLEGVASAQPDATIHLESGERTPRSATVIEGFGTATGRDAMPHRVAPGETIHAGARLYGGPFTLRLRSDQAFMPEPRPAPLTMSGYERYLQGINPLSLAYAGLTALLTRSLNRTFVALLLVNPRTAIIGMESADLNASARVLRAGATVVGTRATRTIRRPDVLVLDGPRLVCDGFDVASVQPLSESCDTNRALTLAASIAAAVGSPWGSAFRASNAVAATDASFDGATATATVAGTRYWLGPLADPHTLPVAARQRQRGNHVLALRQEHDAEPLAFLALRPRLVPAAADLLETCRRHGVDISLLPAGERTAADAVAHRSGIPLLARDDALAAIRAAQGRGKFVAFVSDNADAGAAFAACDLAIGLTTGRTRLPARADLLAPDLAALADIVEAGARRDAAVRDAVALSVLANGIGAVRGWRTGPGVNTASTAIFATALGAVSDSWLRMSGGERREVRLMHLVDPRPERWGRRDIADVLSSLNSTETGLTGAAAQQRQQAAVIGVPRPSLLATLTEQLRSPLTAILMAGAGVSLMLGAPADVVIIGATIAANVGVSAWQEHKANQVAETLQRLGTPTARVLRDGQPVTVRAENVVRGDVLLLAPGDRVVADARVLSAQGLEVDEAALTGESLPVSKLSSGGANANHVVLAGSDVTAGNGRVVAFAVGRQTRMGTITAALSADQSQQNPLDTRLSHILSQVLPLAVGAGVLVAGVGALRTGSLIPQFALGASVTIAAVPEGLPLLTRVSEAGVARRLADQNALVRRIAAVEALGRVDVACTDKTGTLTQGRLALQLVADVQQHEAAVSAALPPDLLHVLLSGALASPQPGSEGAAAHPTDAAIVTRALQLGLSSALRQPREAEVPFDPARPYHATRVGGRLCVKGAPEELIPRCAWLRRGDNDEPVTLDERDRLSAQAQQLASRGLRVLMVAETTRSTPMNDPSGLVALGFLGLSDPLRPTVRAAVRRCHEAGVHVIMLTGDHPATARTIAREAGLLNGGQILTGTDIAELQNGELDERIEQATVIARATPLDKLRIIESLQRRGHTV